MHPVARHTSILRLSLARPSRLFVPRARLIPSVQRASISRGAKPLTFRSTKIARMSTESTQSQACCNTPAVVSKGYQPKGDYIEVDGLKTCMAYTFFLCYEHFLTTTRCHRLQRRQTWHPRCLRHLRLLQPDPPGRRYPRLHRQG